MSELGPRESRYGLENHGIKHPGKVYWNLSTAQLYEEAVRRGEGLVASSGCLVVKTGKHTGRSANDKFVVREPSSEDNIAWGKINVPMEPHAFDRLHSRVLAYLQSKDLYVQDLYVGADPNYRSTVRFINEMAWHDLFVRSLFLKPLAEELQECAPDFTVIHAPNFYANPEIDGTRSECFITLHLGKKLILIGGTSYAGEQKKSIFTVMNYLLPLRDILTMHCSCNYSKENGDVALFFGLSGTGKTTLSADPERTLIGDDEHAWSDEGVFNIEGGCYAKVINLSQEAEPQIWSASHRFGSVLENVVIDPATRQLDLDDDSLTENTRSAYPVSYIPACDQTGRTGHPKNVVFLTADAFGVLPPISRLTPDQAMYHFLIGYTARLAGTEKGVTEPQATFSTCFGGPFMALRPAVYAKLLGEKVERHKASCWLINTGWFGGPAGVAPRVKIAHTRAMLRAAISGALDNVEYIEHPVLKLFMPTSCPGVPDGALNPRDAWEDKAAYDVQVQRLAQLFKDNFKAYEADVTQDVINSGPQPG